MVEAICGRARAIGRLDAIMLLILRAALAPQRRRPYLPADFHRGRSILVSRAHYLFTSESVSEGHPDKVCDQISDAIVDLYLDADPYARVALETLATTNRIVLAGEVRGPHSVTHEAMEEAARECVKQHRLRAGRLPLARRSRSNATCMSSPATSRRASTRPATRTRARATRASCSAMPAPRPKTNAGADLLRPPHPAMTSPKARHSGAVPELGPDAKSQVTLLYENGKPVKRDLGRRLHPAWRRRRARSACARSCAPSSKASCRRAGCAPEDEFYVNPTGRFVIGGPDGDAGLTGRKIIVDTYGGAAPHGGGAFSGKDPTKVDRSAAYAARYLAKNVVAAGLAEQCTHPALLRDRRVEAAVDLCRHRTAPARSTRTKLTKALTELMDLSPRGIRKHLGSTARSMRAPRPMAISAASPRPMAASPGRSSTWSSRWRCALVLNG